MKAKRLIISLTFCLVAGLGLLFYIATLHRQTDDVVRAEHNEVVGLKPEVPQVPANRSVVVKDKGASIKMAPVSETEPAIVPEEAVRAAKK